MSEEYIASKPKVGDFCKGRIVSPEDFDRWEQQRAARKTKKVRLDPYRYLD